MIYRRKRRDLIEGFRKTTFIVLCVLAFSFLFLIIQAWKLNGKKVEYEKRAVELQKQIDIEEERSQSLKELEEYAGTNEYIEDVAREKLGLVYPNEIILKKK